MIIIMNSQFYKYAVGLTEKLQFEADCFVKIHKSIRKLRKIYLSNIYLYVMSEDKVKYKVANSKVKKMISSLHSSEFVLLGDSKGVLIDDLSLRQKMRKELLNYNPHMEVAYVKETMLDDYVEGNKLNEKEETLVLNLVRMRNQFEEFGSNIKEKNFRQQYSTIDLIIKEEYYTIMTAQKKHEGKQQKKGFSLFKREKKELYTVKVYQKKLIGQNKVLLQQILRQRKCLQQILSPYTPVLYKCIFSNSTIYCLTQFYRGTPLKIYLQNQTLTKTQFKCLVSQIITALGQIHQCNLVYNNVNLEHIFIIDEGFVLLNNFANCLEVNTPVSQQNLLQLKEMHPPSQGESEKISSSWDWWNLGRLIYQMKQGKKWQSDCKIIWPKEPQLFQLVTGLLEGEPAKRLGYRNGYHEVLAHPYFKNINKKQLATRTCQPLKKFFTSNPQKIDYSSDGEDWSINDSLLEDYQFSRELQ